MVLFRFGLSFSWHPVVPLASLNSVIIWVVLCHPSFCRCFYDLRREALSLDLVFTVVLPLDTDGFVFSTMSSLCGNLSRQKFDVDMESSSLLVVLNSSSSLASPFPPFPPGSSWISGRDPLLVVASCTSPEIHPNLNFRLLRCCAICLTCLRCLLRRNNNR